MKTLFLASILLASPALADGEKEVADARKAITDLGKGRFDDRRAPRMGVFNEWQIEVSTFDTGIEVPTLYELVKATAKKMESLWPGMVKTYYFEDQFGYPSWKVVVNFDPPLQDLELKYLSVGYSQSNDHSTYWFYTSRQEFEAAPYVEVRNGPLSDERLAEETKAWRARQKKE